MPDNDDGGQTRAEWGLRCYVQQVAVGLGIGLESACCEAVIPASVYLALTQRLDSAPGRDVALCWDATHGWAVEMETGVGGDLIVVAYLGSVDVLPDSESVVVFAKTVLADQPAGQANAPVYVADDGLASRLADYVPTLIP